MTTPEPGHHTPEHGKDAGSAPVTRAKQSLRQRQLAGRAERRAERFALDARRTPMLLDALARVPGPVALYLSRDDEPDTLEVCRALVGQRPVLAPVLQGHPAPTWAPVISMDALRPGLWGIPEPTTDAVGPDVLAQVAVVLVSGLAGTPDGRRLGVGGGWFDRALLAMPRAERWLLLDEVDVLDDLPCEPHDVRVHRLVTPAGVVVCG